MNRFSPRITSTLRSVAGRERDLQDRDARLVQRQALVTELEHARAMEPAALEAEIAKLDAQAAAERAQREKAAALARMDELVKADRATLVKRRAHYLVMAADKATHVVRWEEAVELSRTAGIPNRVHGFDFAGDPAHMVGVCDTLLSAP